MHGTCRHNYMKDGYHSLRGWFHRWSGFSDFNVLWFDEICLGMSEKFCFFSGYTHQFHHHLCSLIWTFNFLFKNIVNEKVRSYFSLYFVPRFLIWHFVCVNNKSLSKTGNAKFFGSHQLLLTTFSFSKMMQFLHWLFTKSQRWKTTPRTQVKPKSWNNFQFEFFNVERERSKK